MPIPENERLDTYEAPAWDVTKIDYATKGDRSYVNRPDSTNIACLEFDHATRTLFVTFRNGGYYSYQPCAFETFMALVMAESAGKAFNHHIRKAQPGTYEVTKIDRPVLGVDTDLTPKLTPIPLGGDPHVITDDDLEDAGMPRFDPSLDELERALLEGDPAAFVLEPGDNTVSAPASMRTVDRGDVEPGQHAILDNPTGGSTRVQVCDHLNLPAAGGPMVRCPDCGRIVSRP